MYTMARACVATLWRGKPQRVTHASDPTQLKLGDYFDMATFTSCPGPRGWRARRQKSSCRPCS